MGAWETDGYNMSINPYWVNKDKSGGGGGDMPTPSHPGEMIVSKLSADYQSLETEWKDIKAAMGGNAVPFGSDADVGKVLSKTGSGTGDIGWVTPSGGGSDIPDFPNQRGFFLKTAQGDDGIQLEWENFKDNVKEIVHPIFQNDSLYVGKVLTRYGTGINDYGWEDVPGGNSETILFDDFISVNSSATGAGWAEIPVADRVELFDSNNLLKFQKIHMDVSFVTELKADVRTKTENFSCDIDLNRVLVSDAQNYSDPEYSSITDNNAQAYVNHAYLVGSGETYTENIIEVNLNFNMFGTNPDPAVNTFAGRLLGLYFENRLVSSGAYQALPGEQVIRVKVTAK